MAVSESVSQSQSHLLSWPSLLRGTAKTLIMMSSTQPHAIRDMQSWNLPFRCVDTWEIHLWFLVSLAVLFCLTDINFYQSAALHPLTAPAQAWKPNAKRNLFLADTAVAASAQMQFGSVSPASPAPPQQLESGRSPHFVLQQVPAATVSDRRRKNIPNVTSHHSFSLH